MSEEKTKKCIGCNFYEDDRVNDDGDWVEGWGCSYPCKCPPKPKETNPALSDLEKEYEHLSSITKFLI